MNEKLRITLPKEIFFEETVVNKSRFLAFATGVETVEEAMDFVNSIKKKYYDATHNCYAYVVGNFLKFSDDGEPSGTAGKPILNALQQKGFCDTVLVVTRYFGGIKLGAGGLVRAYGGAASDLLSKLPTLALVDCVDVLIKVAYGLQNFIVNLATKDAISYKIDYDTSVNILVTLKREAVEKFVQAAENAVNGKADFVVGNVYGAKVQL